MIQKGGEGCERRVILGMQSGGHCGRRSSDGRMLKGVSIYSASYISGQKDATRERHAYMRRQCCVTPKLSIRACA